MNCELPLILTTINILVVYVTHNLLYCSKFKLAFWGRSSNSQLLNREQWISHGNRVFKIFPTIYHIFIISPHLVFLYFPFFLSYIRNVLGCLDFLLIFPDEKARSQKDIHVRASFVPLISCYHRRLLRRGFRKVNKNTIVSFSSSPV